MPSGKQTEHKVLTDLRWPWKTFDSPISTDPMFQDGQNVLVSIPGYMERRPGFGATAVPGTFTGTIVRIFQWKKWGTVSGSYYAMVCSTDSTSSYVYKFQFGVDVSAVLLHVCTTSNTPFDFVTSNNTVYFGKDDVPNEMWKYDGTNLWKWGIDAPTAPTVATSTAIACVPRTAAGTNWTTPQNALATETPSELYATYSGTAQNWLSITNFRVLISDNSAAAGIVVTIKGNATDANATNRTVKVALTKDGVTPVGTPKTLVLNQTTDTTTNLGGAADLWGATFSSAELNASTFGVLIADNDTTAAGTLSIAAVSISVTPVLINSTAGYYYRAAYGCSVTGHQSSPSDISACTGVWTGKVVNVQVNPSTDPQVDQIHVYRTTDGGSTNPIQMQEIQGSPFTNPAFFSAAVNTYFVNGSQAAGPTWYVMCTKFTAAGEVSATGDLGPITIGGAAGGFASFHFDGQVVGPQNTADVIKWRVYVGTAAGSYFQYFESTDIYNSGNGVRFNSSGQNYPSTVAWTGGSPTISKTISVYDVTNDLQLHDIFCPALQRNDPPKPMRGFITSVNRIAGFSGRRFYYGGYEEIANGVPEESFPGGDDGNFRDFPSAIGGLADMTTGAAILTGNKIWGVEGDSLDTFRWNTIMASRGTLAPTCVLSVMGDVAWVDTAKQVWTSNLGEIGVDLRPTLNTLDFTQTQICVHSSGSYHWIVVMDGANQRLLIANLDLGRWMLPWPIAGVTAISSGETSNGVVDLLIAKGGKILKLTPAIYQDDTTPYSAFFTSNLFDISPEQNPDYYGYVDYIGLETDATEPSQVSLLADEDTHSGTYNPITVKQDPALRPTQGAALLKKEYRPELVLAQRISLRVDWPATNSNFHLYSIDIAQRQKASI